MKTKGIFKISIDFVMTILLLLLMARQITGYTAHEWLGAGIFVLWIAHYVLNRNGTAPPPREIHSPAYITVHRKHIALPFHAGLHGKCRYSVKRGFCIPAAYVLYAFIQNQLCSYLFLTSSFVYFDFERPIILFFTEYVTIMGMFVFLAHYGTKALQRLHISNRTEN